MSSNLTSNVSSTLHNNGSVNAQLLFPTELKACLYVLYSLIFFFGTIGNGLVCCIIGIKKKRRSNCDILIASLAVADLLASVFGPLSMIIGMVTDFKLWYFGNVGCVIIHSVSPITLLASSWSLVLISLDRYRAISWPLSLESTTRQKIFGLMLIWIIAFCACVPYSLALKVVDRYCWVVFSSSFMSLVWNGCYLVIGWIIPFIVMTGSYSGMAWKLKVGEGNHTNNPETCNSIRKENRRAVNLFVTIVCAYFLLTMPYAVFYFTYSYLMYTRPYDINSSHMVSANHGLFVLTLINSCTNPVIYARMHSKIRETIKKLFCQMQIHPDSSARYRSSTQQSAHTA